MRSKVIPAWVLALAPEDRFPGWPHVGGGADVGNFDNIGTEIKDVYPTGSFDSMYNKEAPYRAKLKKNNDYGMNEGVVKFPLKMNGMWSVGIVADNAAFPTAKDPTTVKGQLTPENFAATIQIGIKTKAAAKSGKSTFNSQGTLSERIENNVNELVKYVNKVYAGTNRGRLAIVESDGTNNFIAAKPLGVELLQEGMRLEAATTLAGGTLRDSFSNHKITAIDYDTRTVTYVGAADTNDDRTLVAGDHIFITGTSGTARGQVGLMDIVDDGTLAGTIFTQSRTTYPKLKASVLGNGGSLRNITEQIILDAIDRPRRRVGKKVTRVLSNSGQARKYVEFVAADRRYPGETNGDPRYAIGYSDDSLQIVAPGVNARLEVDYDVQPRSIFCLSWDTFFLYEAMPPDWIDANAGGDLLNLIPSTDTHKAGFLAYYGSVENQGCLMPLASSRIDDLKDAICGDV